MNQIQKINKFHNQASYEDKGNFFRIADDSQPYIEQDVAIMIGIFNDYFTNYDDTWSVECVFCISNMYTQTPNLANLLREHYPNHYPPKVIKNEQE